MDALRTQHQNGIKGILYFYDKKRLKKSLPFKIAIVVSFILSMGILFGKYSILKVLGTLVEMGTSLFPNLLGFTLGGFSLIVGFTSSDSLKKFTIKKDEAKGTFFQVLMAIFSISILQQAASIILSYTISFTLKEGINFLSFIRCKTIFDVINYLAFMTISWFYLWSLLTIPYVVTNLFNFAQANHLISTVARMKDEEKLNPDDSIQFSKTERN